jgi:Spx/MgsR family transcriptional regulator
MIIYGIKSCDSIKKATLWLAKHKMPFEFHDYKTRGISMTHLKRWSKQIGWETFMNKKSTTWRSFDPALQASITNEQAALKLMMENTSLIKRPLIERDGKILVLGYNEEEYTRVFLSGKA